MKKYLPALLALLVCTGCTSDKPVNVSGGTVPTAGTDTQPQEEIFDLIDSQQAALEKAQEAAWKKIYYDYISNTLPGIIEADGIAYTLKELNYGFIYVNDDRIPELICQVNFEPYCIILSTDGEQIFELKLTDSFSFMEYAEKYGLIHTYIWSNDYTRRRHEFYRLEKDGWKTLECARQIDAEGNYIYCEETVDDEILSQKIDELFDSNDTWTWVCGTDYIRMSNYLQDIIYDDDYYAYLDLLWNGFSTRLVDFKDFALLDSGQGSLVITRSPGNVALISNHDNIAFFSGTYLGYGTDNYENCHYIPELGALYLFSDFEYWGNNSIYVVRDGSLLSRYIGYNVRTDDNGNYLKKANGEYDKIFSYNMRTIPEERYNKQLIEFSRYEKLSVVHETTLPGETEIEFQTLDSLKTELLNK